jgi:hypothetical protein
MIKIKIIQQLSASETKLVCMAKHLILIKRPVVVTQFNSFFSTEPNC